MQLRNINKKYKDKVVFNNMNLEITKPGVYGIIGLSGSGKTTLLNMLYGIDTNFDGEYTIDNKKLKELKILNEYNDNISLVFQDTKLLENLTGYDNLMLANKTNNNIEELLNKFGILDLRDVEVKYYSGGEKQRLAIARALINEPKIILLDEPTAALDDRNTKFVLETIKNIGSDKIIVVISHDERIIDHIDNLYELKDQNITLIKSAENNNSDVVLKDVEKNKNKISKVAFKNFKANKKSLIPTACALIVATIIFMMLSFLIIPPIKATLEVFGNDGETSTFTHTSECFQYYYDGQETSGVCDIDETAINQLAENEDVIEVTPTKNITESLYLSTEIHTTINEEILEFFGYELDSPEALATNGQPLKVYANVSPNNSMNNISLDESNIKGTLPDEVGEIAITNTMAMLLFDTTNYNEVIGETITINFSLNKYLTEEEQNKIIAEAELKSEDVVYPTYDFSYNFTISAVYQYGLKGYELDNFENQIENASQDAEYEYAINDTLITYIPPYHALSDVQKQNFLDLFNYTNGSSLTTENFTTGYTRVEVVTVYDEALTDTYTNELAQGFGIENDQIYVVNKTYEKLFVAIGLLLIGFIVIALFIAVTIMCLNLMNLKMRKDEFAKYYLIGFSNYQVLKSIMMEMLYLNLIVLPIGITLSLILFKIVFDVFVISALWIVILITIIIIIFINSLILLWYFYTNRRKKILKNLREAK